MNGRLSYIRAIVCSILVIFEYNSVQTESISLWREKNKMKQLRIFFEKSIYEGVLERAQNLLNINKFFEHKSNHWLIFNIWLVYKGSNREKSEIFLDIFWGFGRKKRTPVLSGTMSILKEVKWLAVSGLSARLEDSLN